MRLIENIKEKSLYNRFFVSIFDLRIIIVIAIALTIFYLIPIPNFIQIDSETGSNILTIVIGSLASILGVLIAIVLVAFNIMRKYYNAYAFKTFFKDRNLNSLVTIYVTTIILSFLTLIFISEVNTTLFKLFISCVGLFIISMIILFPLSQRIINSTQSKERISDIVEKINPDTIKVLIYGKEIMPSYDLKDIDENPMFVLNDLAIRTLNDNDLLTSIVILEEIEKKLFATLSEIIKNNPQKDSENSKQELRETINVFLIIVKTIAYHAIELQQEGVLRNVIVFIESLHDFRAKNQVAWYDVIELNYFIGNLLELFLDSKLEYICRMGIQMNARIMINYIKFKLPKEEEIFDLVYNKDKKLKHEDFKTDYSLEWHHISMEYTKIISQITKNAVKLHKDEIVDAGMNSLVNIISEIIPMDIGDNQKLQLVRRTCWEIHELTKLRSNEGVGSNFYVHTLKIELKKGIKLGEELFKQLMFTYTFVHIILAKNKGLDWFDITQLRVAGEELKHCPSQSPLCKKSLICIVKLFDKLREIFEDDIEKNQLAYITLFEQVNLIKDWAINSELEMRIDKLISNFSNYETLKKEIDADKFELDCL